MSAFYWTFQGENYSHLQKERAQIQLIDRVENLFFSSQLTILAYNVHRNCN
jgi:hypothetical protein